MESESPTRPLARRYALLLSLGLLLTVAGPATAGTIYKWTDEDGVTHYSDNPPQGREYQKLEMDTAGPRPSPDSKAQKKGKSEEDGEVSATDVNISEAEIAVQRLEEKVQRAQEIYEKARQNRIKGEQIRLGSEQNYVRYLERIENLKQQEQAAKKRLENLRSQLQEARSRLEKLREQKRKAQESGPSPDQG